MALCLFCYKHVYLDESEKICRNDKLLDRFEKLIERFIGGKGVKLGRIWEDGKHEGLLGCCGDCKGVILGFCEAYHEMKCWEMRTEWKLGMLVGIMKMANRVPGRVGELKRRLEEVLEDDTEAMLKTVKSLRQELIRKSSKRLVCSLPRVKIKEGGFVKPNRLSDNPELLVPVISEELVIFENQQQTQIDQTALLQKWILSISAVALLVTFSSNGNVERPVISGKSEVVDEHRMEEEHQTPSFSDAESEPISPEYRMEVGEDQNLSTENIALEVNQVSNDSEEQVDNVEDKDLNSDNTDLPVLEQKEVKELNDELPNFEPQHEEILENAEVVSVDDEFDLKVDIENVSDLDCDFGDNDNAEVDVLLPSVNPPKSSETENHVTEKSTNVEITENISEIPEENDEQKRYHLRERKQPISYLNANENEEGIFPPIPQSSEIENDNPVTEISTGDVTIENNSVIVEETDEQMRYRLRRKRPVSYRNSNSSDDDDEREHSDCQLSDESDEENSDEDDDPIDGSNSNSSLSDSSIDSDNSEPKHKRSKGYGFGNDEVIRCTLEDCKTITYEFSSYVQYSQHLNLHTPGQFQCHVCQVEQDTLISLSLHERSAHLITNQDETDKETSEHFKCSRCNFQTPDYDNFLWHFDIEHFSGVKPSISTKPDKKEVIQCRICKRSIVIGVFAKHWLSCHNTEGVDPHKIIHCPIENCSAYFMDMQQYRHHRSEVHYPEEGVSGTVYCEFCQKRFSKLTRLLAHRMRFHRKFNKEPLIKPRKARKSKLLIYEKKHEGKLRRLKRGRLPDPTSARAKRRKREGFIRGFRGYGFADNEVIRCKLNGCKSIVHKFATYAEYSQHLNLHTIGKFQCKFCEIEENSEIAIIFHEKLNHLTKQDENCASDNLFCTRCNFQTQDFNDFLWHYDVEHFGGVKPAVIDLTNKEEATIPCKACKRNIFYRLFEKHWLSCHNLEDVKPAKIVRCEIDNCSAYFLDISQRRHHIVEVHGITQDSLPLEQCPLCTKKCVGLERLEAHKLKFHPDGRRKADRKFACSMDDCTKSFYTEEQLEAHKKKQHGWWKCHFCDKVKSYAIDLILHELEHAPKRLEGEKIMDGTVKFYNCPRCCKDIRGRKLYVAHHLKEHLQIKPEECRPVCQICKLEGMATSHYGFNKRHMQAYHNTEGMKPEDISRCDQCPAYFVKPDQLLAHLINYHCGRKCPECGKQYNGKLTFFPNHMIRRHPQNKLFAKVIFRCEHNGCKATFVTREAADKHKITCYLIKDSDTKTCDKCGKTFVGERKLQKHLDTVHVEKSNVCEECGKAFKTQAGLTLHLEYHKKPEEWKFACTVCGRRFADKQKLNQHGRTHTKEKPFVCQYCGDKYAHRHNWRIHMKSKHSDLYEETDVRKKGNYLSRKGSKKGECITTGVEQNYG